ncbi:hypothetical protein [Plantactinospora sp. WMMB782]|uniref:phage terminase small subunit n=1 Tax=Plantactinospora sp. WMMB782 TaxID=3404121 RepID=UPI003B962F9A
MGQRGPVPNRSDDLARPRERKGGDTQPVTKGKARPIFWPEPDPDWHPIALMLWESCQISGQADFYQQSDIALLYSLCEDLSHYKTSTYVDKDGVERTAKRSGQMLQTIYSSFERLLIAEGDRRRVRLELDEEEQGEDASVTVMDDYKRGLGLAQ